jgi:hypothetical protein
MIALGPELSLFCYHDLLLFAIEVVVPGVKLLAIVSPIFSIGSCAPGLSKSCSLLLSVYVD